MKDIAIIGSGVGGLALSIRMAIKGASVTVFEANSYPGGKLSEINIGNYRFDAGPSLFTLPYLVDELFELSDNENLVTFEYEKLKEICTYFWDDGIRFTVPSSVVDFDSLVHKELGENKGQIIKYLADSSFKYKILNGLFLERSLHLFSTWFSKSALSGYLNLPKMGIFSTLNEHNKRFFKNPKTIQMFNRYATYNGSNAYKTPATMGIIPHLEYNIGAFFPKDGMYGITQSLYNLAISKGVKINFKSRVDEIVIGNGKAKSLVVNGQSTSNFDAIVSNMDVTPTYRNLMPKQKAPNKILNQEKSGSGLIFYWGIKRQFSELGLHNIFFSNNYEEEFKSQFQKNTIYDDPTIYLNVTSKHKTDDAPVGCENWFILINAPANKGQDWDLIIEKTRQNIIIKLNSVLKVNLIDFIECEEILDPRSIQIKTSSDQGALYGNSSNNIFSAFLRHPNFSSSIENLFFVGGSVHPGGGIPLALSSAKITSDFLARLL